MKTKLIQSLFLVIFILVFGYFFGDEYWEFQSEQKISEISQKNITQQISDFDIEKLSSQPIASNLYITPDRWFLNDIVAFIDAAQKKIYVEIYIFTERDMRDALIRAHNRGVDVKILMENNPYKAPYLNDKHYASFKDAWVDVRWSDPLNYSLNHSKLLLIDNAWFVSTGNFSYSLFTKNRDFIVELNNKELINSLYELFENDFYHKKEEIYHENLVVSPYYSRSKMQVLLEDAKETVDFYFPYLADEQFMEKMLDLWMRGITVRWIVSKDFYNENPEMIQQMQERGLDIHYMSSPKLHAKSILVDGRFLYVGSINFSTFSFDENREVWLILKDDNIISRFIEQFNSDF